MVTQETASEDSQREGQVGKEAATERPQERKEKPNPEPKEEPSPEPREELGTEPNSTENPQELPKGKDASSSVEAAPESVAETGKDTGVPEPNPGPPSCDLSNPKQDKYPAGSTHFGRNLYIKYMAGTLPILLSAPHGGSLKPSEIKDRTQGVLGNDSNSRSYTLEVARRIFQLTGQRPHIVINRLHRIKLDANRDIKEASQGDKNSETAWAEFRNYMLEARKVVTARCKRGHYFDMHTNGHSEAWVELGILLRSSDLAKSNAVLDSGSTYKHKSSWKAMTAMPGIVFSEILRGSSSLGAMLQARGYKTVPSPTHPDPKGGGFFSGGYNTASYGSRKGGTIDGTQVETHFSMITTNTRYKYSRALAESILTFMERVYGFKLRNPVTVPPHSRCSNAKLLTFQQGSIIVQDSTWPALVEFPGKLNCGTTATYSGPQLYYTFSVKSGKSYVITLKPNFPSRFYLFAGSCSVSDINAQCKASGVNGILAETMQEKAVTYLAKKTGRVRLAVGSRYRHWFGDFRLQIQEKP